MFKNLLKKKNQSGFTIIEVMIVLAIAGLILVVVLIAVPQLQRNQRNSARKSDASRVATTVGNIVANQNGAVYTSANQATMINEIGTLAQYEVTTPATTFAVAAGVQTGVTDPRLMRVVTGAKCGAAGATVVGSNTRVFAIQYGTENNASTATTLATPQCI